MDAGSAPPDRLHNWYYKPSQIPMVEKLMGPKEERTTPVSIYEHAVKLLSKCDVILCKEEDTYLVRVLRIHDC